MDDPDPGNFINLAVAAAQQDASDSAVSIIIKILVLFEETQKMVVLLKPEEKL